MKNQFFLLIAPILLVGLLGCRQDKARIDPEETTAYQISRLDSAPILAPSHPLYLEDLEARIEPATNAAFGTRDALERIREEVLEYERKWGFDKDIRKYLEESEKVHDAAVRSLARLFTAKRFPYGLGHGLFDELKRNHEAKKADMVASGLTSEWLTIAPLWRDLQSTFEYYLAVAEEMISLTETETERLHVNGWWADYQAGLKKLEKAEEVYEKAFKAYNLAVGGDALPDYIPDGVEVADPSIEPTEKPYNNPAIKEGLYNLQGGYCVACRVIFPLRNLEVDHIIARDKGGTNELENLQLLCSTCNRVKGNRGMEYLMAKLAELE